MDRKSYISLHSWIRHNFGSANKCESLSCSKVSNNFQWSLLKGKKYEKKRENFWMLCSSCHKLYDFNNNARINLSLSHKGKHSSPKTEFKKGIIPWNKGLKGVCKPNSGSFKKGHNRYAKQLQK